MESPALILQKEFPLESMVHYNQFLDVNDPPVSGSLVLEGNPMSQLRFPRINTLIAEIHPTPGVPVLVNRLPTQTSGQVVLDNQNIAEVGFQLNLPGGLGAFKEINPAQQISVSTTAPQIPTNWHEAYQALKMISPTRAGSNTKTFSFQDLKLIARNLNLESVGSREKKEALANRLRDAIKKYFNVKE